MEIEGALTAYLLGYAGLTALISRRIYFDDVPQITDPQKPIPPFVSIIKVSDVKDHLLSGQSEVETPVFQFTAYAPTKAEVRAISNQLKLALQDYVGTLSGLVIQKIELQNEMSGMDKSPDGTIKIFTEDQEYEITFERS